MGLGLYCMLSSLHAATVSADAVKMRYVALLSTFIRGETAHLAACIYQAEAATTIDNESGVITVTTLTESADCKSIYFADNTPTPLPEEILSTLGDKLIITDSDAFCDIADVVLFNQGKRIFFNISLAAVDAKPFSLAPQVLRLSKPNNCGSN